MNRKYKSHQADNWWFYTQKSPSSGFFYAVFLETTHEQMVPTYSPNTHPRSHLSQKETTDLLNLPRCGTITNIQNFSLYCKIDTVIQLFRRLYK